jgi:two-component system, OmpR family, aerobic respiration control sensor histidine kinase ArcB
MPHRDPITRALSAIDPRDAPALALLGHDLRATVSEVIGGLRLIDLKVLPAESRHQISRTRAAAEAMTLLLEQALMLLLGDSPVIFANQTCVDTAQLLESIDLRWKTLAAHLGLGFILVAAENLPSQLAVDAVLLERLLANLLGNAIKYAGQGTITCTLDLNPDQQLALRVQDQGPGFANADPFANADRLAATTSSNQSSPKSGSGLGLQLVKDLVVQAGGQITAHNRPEGGAEVNVLLPLSAAAMPTSQHPTALPDLNGLRILVADDSETSRLILHTLLTNMGATVCAARDGAQALTLIETQAFDALLIDVEMPRVTGLEVIQHVRKLPPPKACLPILAVTAYQMRANRQAILAAGADDALSKPIAEAAILGETLLRCMQAKSQKANISPAPLAQINPVAFNGLLKMAGPSVADELITRLLADLGAAKRALLVASHAPNWPDIRTQTHILIALAGTTGAERLHHLVQNVNDLAHQLAPDLNTFHTLLPQVLESLDILIHFIDHKSPQPEESA